jgi:hypothetical protein
MSPCIVKSERPSVSRKYAGRNKESQNGQKDSRAIKNILCCRAGALAEFNCPGGTQPEVCDRERFAIVKPDALALS